jgi:hypothetical protein
MAVEIYPSSFRCDCGQELDFFENTIRDMKKMSKYKRVRLGEEDQGKDHWTFPTMLLCHLHHSKTQGQNGIYQKCQCWHF